MLMIKNTRYVGAGIVAITFLISALLLIMDGNIPFATFTFIAMLMLGAVMKQSLMKEKTVRDGIKQANTPATDPRDPL